jgi:hypothetical protein
MMTVYGRNNCRLLQNNKPRSCVDGEFYILTYIVTNTRGWTLNLLTSNYCIFISFCEKTPFSLVATFETTHRCIP